MKRTIVTILGTRPEIIKLSPVLPLLDSGSRHTLVHTGQHYDENMDRIFFRELHLKQPDHFLNVGSAGLGQGVQTGRMLELLEPILAKAQPDWVAVLGDTNTTLAGALTAAKLNVPVAHIEAGCRSFNRKAPEEQNRVMVDHIADLLFAPDREAVGHLLDEGIARRRIHLVGSTAIDATRRTLRFTSLKRLQRYNVQPGGFVLVTLHRAETTSDADRLASIVAGINQVSRFAKVVFPVHPRTLGALKERNLKLEADILQLPAIGNLDFLTLLRYCIFVMSDSGGVQEEAAVVNRPCLILRDETEWTRIVTAGKNVLAGTATTGIVRSARRLFDSADLRERMRRRRAPLQAGAAKKIAQLLMRRAAA